MKKINLLFFFCALFTGKSIAQVNAPGEYDTLKPYGQQILVNGQFDFLTTSLKNEISNTLLFGGYIDEGMKDRSLKKHKTVNFAGLASNNDITYFHNSDSLFHNPNLSWGVKAGYYAVGNVSYSKDAFGLVFYGNEPYLGDTAHFSRTKMNFTRFQKIGFGVRDKRMGSYVFLNLVNLQDAVQSVVRKGDLYQDTDGSEVKMKLAGEFDYTSGNSFSKGLGFSIDAAYRVKVPWVKETQTIFEVSANNLGIVFTNNSVTQYHVDSNYTFTGFELNQLFGSSSPFSRDDYSVLDSMGVSKDTMQRRSFILPGYIQAGKLVNFQGNQKWQSYFGLRLYPSLDILPQAYAGACYKPVAAFMISANASYGGFGFFNAGLNFTYIAPKLRITLGTDNAIGAVLASGYGKSFIIRSVWDLN
jgi:hypothetical protein